MPPLTLVVGFPTAVRVLLTTTAAYTVTYLLTNLCRICTESAESLRKGSIFSAKGLASLFDNVSLPHLVFVDLSECMQLSADGIDSLCQWLVHAAVIPCSDGIKYFDICQSLITSGAAKIGQQ